MILAEIQSVNSTFASASLPVNTTNRTQNKNQVFIPMFRPDPSDRPLWMGNLKQYQLIADSSGNIDLGDNSSPPINAVNPLTGFVTPCAESFWTTDSGTYWEIRCFRLPHSQRDLPIFRERIQFLVRCSGRADRGERRSRRGDSQREQSARHQHDSDLVGESHGLHALRLGRHDADALHGEYPGNSSGEVSLANFILGHDVNDENINNPTFPPVLPIITFDPRCTEMKFTRGRSPSITAPLPGQTDRAAIPV